MKRNCGLYAPFSKVEEQSDGTLKVYGIASSEAEDSDGEVIKADAMRAAIPDYMAFGAVREMHQAIAAGTALEANVNDAGVTEFAAHVVDPVSVKKVQTGVLKGFSIGGRVTKRNDKNKSIIEGLKLTEISLVDRPANPDCVVTMVKFTKDGRVEASAGTLRKGMYEVSRFADILCSLHYLTASVMSEEVFEGDGSAIGSKLKEVCAEMIAVLKEMVDEETAEILGLNAGTIAESAKMAKALSSGSTLAFEKIVAELGELRKANQPGATVKTDEELTKVQGELATAKGELTKAQTDLKTASDSLTKVTAERDSAVTERDTAKAALTKAEGERDELAKESEKLLSSLTAKGHLRVVEKSADAKTGTDPIVKKDEKPTDAHAEIMKSFASPRIEGPARGALAAK